MSPDPARGARRDADFLKRYDKNGDGKLDDDERADAKEAMLTEQIDRQMKQAAVATGGPGAGPIPADAQASLERVLRTAIEADPAQLRRFDRDQNGKLDDNEWLSARQEILRAFAMDASRPPNAENDTQRRAAIAADLEQRRAMSLAAAGVTPTPSLADEIRRREAVAAEVARRRELRESAASALETTAARQKEVSEREAKELVKDLLDIGMAQRRKYEDQTLTRTPTPEEEKERLAAVAREVERRRALRKAVEAESAAKK